MIIRAVIEILGAPRDYINESLKTVINKVDGSFKIRDKKVYDAVEYQKLWSAFTELELEIKDANALISFCFDYMPSSVEILEPSEFNYKSNDFSGLLNDLLARLHDYDMLAKNLKAENILLKKQGSINKSVS